jgi:hypothetical protein
VSNRSHVPGSTIRPARDPGNEEEQCAEQGGGRRGSAQRPP